MAAAALRDIRLAIVLDGLIKSKVETEKGWNSVPGGPEVGEVGEAPVAEDNQEGAKDVDGKGEQEGVDAQELSSEVPNSQEDERQQAKICLSLSLSMLGTIFFSHTYDFFFFLNCIFHVIFAIFVLKEL